MSWHQYGGFAPYVPVATKIARGHAAAKKLAAKEGRSPAPVKIHGRKITKTFWGTKWCENLERYRDYANRLPRGATYVRNGSVADLVIEPGCVRAIVGGSEAYSVKLEIKTLSSAAWVAISQDCACEIESLFDLLQGRFSEGVMTRLTRAKDGLFPTPSEISLSCTCPDSASVCKHIAATMYGVGSRLDAHPELLFTLRKVDHRKLIGHAASTANLNQSLGTARGMELSDGDLQDIFGIEMELSADSVSAGKKPSKKSAKKASTRRIASPLTKKSTKAVVTAAVRKRRATTDAVDADVPKSSPRKSTTSTKSAVRSKAVPKSSIPAGKAKTPIKPAAAKATPARTKKTPTQSPAEKSTRARRTK